MGSHPTHAVKGIFNLDVTAISFLKKIIVHKTMVFLTWFFESLTFKMTF
jgi:hypothetical protein